MTTFESVHEDQILGSLTTFDRVIFKGYLTGLFPNGAFKRFLDRQGVVLKDFGSYVNKATSQLKEHLKGLAREEGCEYKYLASGPHQGLRALEG